MTTTSSMGTIAFSDADLVAQSLAGNRDAFGQIVVRYQSLICSLAYSVTGSLSRSEDLAQETFLAAWKQLARLRAPEKLRPWLCRIVRNLACDAVHKDGHEPSHRAESLEQVAESHSPEPLPVDRTISNEEQAILWHSIERIPESYREPLVLFYREHQSIEAVARNLELSEDTVRQRLSRGRKMLHEEVLAFVEGALERTNPGKAFTLAVLAAMPAVTFSAKAASVGAVVKGGAGAKTAGAASLFGALLGTLIVFVPNYFAYKVIMAGAQSEQERAGIKSFYVKFGAITMAIFLPIAAFILWLTRHQESRPDLAGLFASILVVIYVPTVFLMALALRRKILSYLSRILNEQYGGIFPKPAFEYCSRWSFLGLPLVHIRVGDQFAFLRKPVKAWIALGSRAVGGLFAFGGMTVAPVSMGGLSIGLLSFGALSFGMVAIGGIATGIWPIFGGLLAGWQSFVGCFAFGWNAAVGGFAFAHDYALGHFAFAAQANNDLAREFIQPNHLYQCASFLYRHWLWMNLFWIVPLFVQWRIYARQTRQGSSARHSARLLVAFLIASVLLSAGCNKSGELGKASQFTAPSGPVELKQHWRTGVRIVKSFDMTVTMEISVPGRPDPVKQDMTCRQEWAITVSKENADGSHEGEMELLKLRIKLDQDGKNIAGFDSEHKSSYAKKDATAAALRQALANAVGAKVRFLLNSSNRVERIEGVEALRDRLAVGGRHDATEGIKGMFNEGYLRQMVGDSQGLPSNAVQPGDAWPVHTDLALGDLGDITTDYDYNFQKWEQRGKRLCARLEFQGTLQGKDEAARATGPNGFSMSIQIQGGEVSGVSWFDPELGLAIEANVNQDLTVVMTKSWIERGKKVDFTMPIRMHQVIAIKLESVTKNGRGEIAEK